MTMNSTGSLDYWRSYFGRANGDIFSIIEHAILVAASDCPKEFWHWRDGIAERLFSSGLTPRCLGCDRDGAELELVTGASKESKANGSGDDQREVNVHLVSSYSYGEAEALTDEIEQESQCVEEVFRIRRILLNFEEESDSVLFESLRRLQLMELTVDLLQATEIGKAVNPLRKDGSGDIRQLARTLIEDDFIFPLILSSRHA